jgi:hypothetical protein
MPTRKIHSSDENLSQEQSTRGPLERLSPRQFNPRTGQLQRIHCP